MRMIELHIIFGTNSANDSHMKFRSLVAVLSVRLPRPIAVYFLIALPQMRTCVIRLYREQLRKSHSEAAAQHVA